MFGYFCETQEKVKILYRLGIRYHEPEYWKFGENKNKYFCHAIGQLYTISRELTSYISLSQPCSAQVCKCGCYIGCLVGLDVTHIDDRMVCFGTPDSGWKAQAGNICVAAFDSTCSDICRSAGPIKEVHMQCIFLEIVIWKLHFEAFSQHINRP
ncbi:hypothetical protein Bca4012_039893 [Brassica carinata]